jgi:hypothetical protein
MINSNGVDQTTPNSNMGQQPVQPKASKVWMIVVLVALLVVLGYVLVNRSNKQVLTKTDQIIQDKTDGEVEKGEQIFNK